MDIAAFEETAHREEKNGIPFGFIKGNSLSIEQLFALAYLPTSGPVASRDKSQSYKWLINEMNYDVEEAVDVDLCVIVCPLHMFLDFSFSFIRRLNVMYQDRQNTCHVYSPGGSLSKLRGIQRVLDKLSQFRVVIVADRHLAMFQKELKQKRYLKPHPFRQQMTLRLQRVMAGDSFNTEDNHYNQLFRDSVAHMTSEGTDIIQQMHTHIPQKHTTVKGLIPKRVIYINAEHMRGRGICGSYQWFLNIAQGCHYTFKPRYSDYSKCIELSKQNTAPFNKEARSSDNNALVPCQTLPVKTETRAYMYHLNMNVVNVKTKFTNARIDQRQQDELAAETLAVSLKQANAQVAPIKELFTVIEKDLISSKMIKALLEGGRSIEAPLADLADFERSKHRLEQQVNEPCSICFKDHFTENLPLVTNCCFNLICYDCFAKTSLAQGACPFCRQRAPMFPPQRYYIPIPNHDCLSGDHQYLKLIKERLGKYIEEGRSEGFSRVLTVQLLSLCKDTTGMQRRVVVQCANELQTKLTASAIMLTQLIYMMREDRRFLWDILYSFDGLGLILKNGIDSSAYTNRRYSEEFEQLIDIQWFENFTIVESPSLFKYCQSGIYIGQMDGIDAQQLAQVTHLISFDQRAIDDIVGTLSDPISIALSSEENVFPLQRIVHIRIPNNQFIPVAIIERE